MIKMVIADDEPVIVRGIQKLADWKSMGIEVAGTYKDGEEAFYGILKEKPDIAILDISMPKMTGIELLKELNAMGIEVHVIFISGFSEFSYAVDALKYGAKGYLLKPVDKEELIQVMGEAIAVSKESAGGGGWTAFEADPGDREDVPLPDNPLLQYIPVYVELFLDQSDRQAYRLMKFSSMSFFEDYMEKAEKGIVISKGEDIYLIFKGFEIEEVLSELHSLSSQAKEKFKVPAVFVYGSQVDDMRKIPLECEACKEKKRYFFFYDQLNSLIISAHKPVFLRRVKSGELQACKKRLQEALLFWNKKEYEEAFRQFVYMVCLMADGRRDNACYHFCSFLKETEEKLRAAGVLCSTFEVQTLLERGRSAKDYMELQTAYGGYMEQYAQEVQTLADNCKQGEAARAKNYIERHFMEDLSLEVLADLVHMDSYYFSSYFKKKTGENFKECLNRVRLEHALPLVVSTRLTSSEIALQTGFKDNRSFCRAFLKMYGRTPAAYRKSMES